jgi:hypothetical protein
MKYTRLSIGLALLTHAGCNATPNTANPAVAEIDSAAASSRPEARWDALAEGKRWTGYVLNALDAHGSKLLASNVSDIAAFCPGYPASDSTARRAFWVGLISALAKHESNYNPAAKYEEGFADSNGKKVISRGLLQISIESGRGYHCDIPNDESLHDPNVNLTCAVKILNRLVSRDGILASNSAPYKGASAYWSPFRDSTKRLDIRNWTKAQAYCR